MREAKTSKLKSLRKESEKAKLILLPFFHLVRDLIRFVHSRKRGSVSDAEVLRSPSGTAQHRSEQVGHSRVKVGRCAAETERER
jgi:hypothetical protein